MGLLNKVKSNIAKNIKTSNDINQEKTPWSITTVLVNWNRIHLLKKTVESYLATVSVPYELIIVDCASSDGSKNYIEEVCKRDHRHQGIFLTEDCGGGTGINLGLELAKAPFLHISENDTEYLPGWDRELLSKFDAFPKLGQICPFSANPEADKGEIWEKHPAKPITKNGKTILLAKENVATSCIIRRQIWEKGVRWRTLPSKGGNKFPADGNFSIDIKKLGYWVAWNDKYTVINWGHNIKEMIEHLDYYVVDYNSKPWLEIKGWQQRLRENGYNLVKENDKYRIVKL